MSARGRCRDCWQANETLNIVQLAHHQGPYFDHWRRQMAASVGGILLDDARTES
jgi:hypothetical protein